MSTKTNNFNFAIKSMLGDGSFAGYASVFGVVDGQNDVVMQGAFTRTLTNRNGHIALLWQHQVDEPIGVFSCVMEDSRGLYVEGRILLDLQRGAEAYSLLKNGAINGLSIGYKVVSADYNADINVRLITDVDLWEISLVTFPANAEAVVRVKEGKMEKGEGRREEGDRAGMGPLVLDPGVLAAIDRAIELLETNPN